MLFVLAPHPKLSTLEVFLYLILAGQEKQILMAKEGEHGNVIYILPPICITEEDVSEVLAIIMIECPDVLFRLDHEEYIWQFQVARCLDEVLAEAEMIGLEKIRWTFCPSQLSRKSNDPVICVRLKVFFNPRSPRQREADEGSRLQGAGGR